MSEPLVQFRTDRLTPADDVLVASLLDRARSVVARVAAVVDDRPAALPFSSKSTPTDVVTEMDQRAEQMLVDGLTADRPDDSVYGEEGAQQEAQGRVRWIIDPIDGTVNYLYGLPIWAISVGIEIDGQVVAGVVSLPGLGEEYYGIVGHGSWVESGHGRESLQVSSEQRLRHSLVATGFGYSAELRSVQAEILTGLITEVRDIRRAGSAAVDLCWLAAGRLDGYFERGLHAWDLAAAGLIVLEAGGRVGSIDGLPASHELVVAGNPEVFDQLSRGLARLDPLRPVPIT